MNTLLQRAKKMKNRKGFTLVELIVVIVIVGILAAILIPRLTGFTDKARDTQALVWAKEIATSIDAYKAENNGYPIDAAGQTEVTELAGVPTEAAITWTNVVNGGFEVTYNDNGTSYTAGRANADSPVEVIEP